MSDTTIEAYITNLGKYNEGELCGEWLKLPATKEDVQSLLARIGVDGVVYEETFIADYETDIDGLSGCLGEYESIDELNYLAVLLSDMNEWDLEKFKAALDYGDDTGSVKGLINLAQNLDCYDHNPDINSDADLGYYYASELGGLDVPESLGPYIDYEAYGRDIRLGEGGVFTDYGYVVNNGGSFTEYYSGRDDIPEECRIFAYPNPPEKMPIREQLEMYGSMASAQTAADRPAPAREDS